MIRTLIFDIYQQNSKLTRNFASEGKKIDYQEFEITILAFFLVEQQTFFTIINIIVNKFNKQKQNYNALQNKRRLQII
jgi:hypothetical protein